MLLEYSNGSEIYKLIKRAQINAMGVSPSRVPLVVVVVFAK